MSNNYFSPNAKVTGGAAFFSFNSKDGCVYVKLLKQIANNADKKGNFDGANPVNVKLSQDEAADIVRAVRSNGMSKFYHKFDNSTTSGQFSYYEIAAKDNFPARSGFGLSVKKTADGKETEVKVGFNLGSAERLSLFLQNALVHIFDAEYAADIKTAKEYQEAKKAKDKAVEPTPSKVADAPDPVDEF